MTLPETDLHRIRHWPLWDGVGEAAARSNQDRYEAKPVGAAATDKAGQVARTLFDAALARGLLV
jgi:hypothetical protein